MRVVCIDVVIESGGLHAAALEDLGRAVWLAMVARLTGDARWIAVVNQHLVEALVYALFIEELFGPPGAESYE
jgi:hypothetical protein